MCAGCVTHPAGAARPPWQRAASAGPLKTLAAVGGALWTTHLCIALGIDSKVQHHACSLLARAACRKAAASGSEPADAIRAVNALLTQLDQLKVHSNVMVLTTSNLCEAIDLAFVDRADIKCYIGNPSLQARSAAVGFGLCGMRHGRVWHVPPTVTHHHLPCLRWLGPARKCFPSQH